MGVVLHKTSFLVLKVIFVLSKFDTLSGCTLSAICNFLNHRPLGVSSGAAFSAFAESSALQGCVKIPEGHLTSLLGSTLKALANFSAGLRSGNLGKESHLSSRQL